MSRSELSEYHSRPLLSRGSAHHQRAMTNRASVGLLVIVLASCGGSPQPDAGGAPSDAGSSACPDGVRPGIVDCPHGAYFAECGGTDEPRFACDDLYGECLWFTGGCVATGYHLSACGSVDLCCVTNARGTWPFEDGWAPSEPRYAANVIEEVGTFAHGPAVGRDAPATLDVEIDAALTAPAVAGVECTGDIGYAFCTGAIEHHATGDALVVTMPAVGTPRSIGWVLEVVRGTGGELVARAFPRAVPDTFPMGAPSCEQSAIFASAERVTGTLVLSAFDLSSPESIHGEAHLTVGSSGTAVVRF